MWSVILFLHILPIFCIATERHYMKEEIRFPIENDIYFPGETKHLHKSTAFTSTTYPPTTQYYRELSDIERELIAHYERRDKSNEESSRQRNNFKPSHPGELFPPPFGGRKKHKRKGARRLCEIKYSECVERIFPDDQDTAADANDADFDGRELAKPGEYPHMAAVGFVMEGMTKVDYKCGGSLISEKFVLTAAHCTLINGVRPSKVRIGDLNLMIDEGSVDPQMRNIQNIFNHPNYRNELYYNDIALLELQGELQLTEFVRPIRLWIYSEVPTTIAFAMGYGATAFAKAITNRLTNLNVTIVPNDECNNELPALTETPYGIMDTQICAHDYIMNRDTCQGDSGGPLQLNLPGKRNRRHIHYHLIGITSYGVFCRSAYPSVYTRVSSYLDWIESVVWSNDTNSNEINNTEEF